jgi:hypothetical protein
VSRRNPKSPEVGPGRMDRLIQEREHDTYKVRGKLPDPTACPECGVMYRAGRWTWGAPPVDAARRTCPACQRIQDDYPGGFLTLGGSFPRAHRQEIEGLARNVEEREKGQHPLKRIMAMTEQEEGLLITTTDPSLARNIGDALHHAYRGELDYQYSEEGNVLRVTWTRGD